MSRVLKYGRGRRIEPESRVKKRNRSASETRPEGNVLSSRVLKHPSNKLKIAKWYYRLLIMLFMILVIGLVIWGKKLSGI
ncbi:hypothetical protein K0U00_10360 [Paenibacillus sepulcri]|uniref:Uncharacterized protein n=1 Tax=Paenibacillus sepulcri TaxID=359917 RepID=A0ABS7C0L0_9BACL|nr:hypothetical protein [Paenibacillus sepulcri]